MPRPGALARVKEDAKRRGKVLTIGKMGFVPDSYNQDDPEVEEKREAGVYQKNKYSDTKLPSSAFASENFHEMDDEDARLDKYSTFARSGKSRDGRNKKDTNQVLAKDPGRGRRILEVYDDSPNGHNLTMGMPQEFEEKVSFLSKKLKTFTLDFPEEFGILHYKLGKLFYAEFLACKDNEKILNSANCSLTFEDVQEMTGIKLKHLENSIFHFTKSREVFMEDSHPIMFGIISMLLGQALRYRVHIMCNNTIAQARTVVNQLTGKGTTALDCARRSMSVLSDVNAVYNILLSASQDKLPTTLGDGDKVVTPLPVILQYKVECAICNLEMGWSYYLQHELLSEVGEEHDDQLSELAIISLERALDLSQSVSLLDPKHLKSFRDPQKFPDYIKLLNNKKSFDKIEGTIYYVLGRIYQDMAYNLRNIKNSSGFLVQSYEYYSTAVKQQYLGAFVETIEWGDCHHRLAAMVLRDPYLVNPELSANVATKNLDPSQLDMLHFDSAITHLKLCLRCLILGRSRFMDIHFHIANCLVAKLNKLIDQGSLSQGSNNTSITKALAEGGDAFEIMSDADFHLHECLMRITPATTQSTLDAYIYYFSCLKLAEIRMLEAATRKDVSIQKRDKLFFEAIGFVVDALQSRTLADNFDLHYVAAKQLVQMIAAAKKIFTASRGYAKVLLVFSCLINRLSFLESKDNANYDLTCEVLNAELGKQESIILQISDKLTRWKKKHIGPLLLTESVTRGYALWSFEQEIVEKVEEDLDSKIEGKEDNKQVKPPDHMPPPTHKKIIQKNSLGMNITMSSLGKKGEKSEKEEGDNAAPVFDRPVGVVPLASLGHIPGHREIMDSLNIHIESLLKYSNSTDVGMSEIDISQSKLGKDSVGRSKRSIWRDTLYLVPHEKDMYRTTLDSIDAIAAVKQLNFGSNVKHRKQREERDEAEAEEAAEEAEQQAAKRKGSETEEEDDSDESVVYETSSEDDKVADKNVLKNKKAAMKSKGQATSSIYFNNTKKTADDEDAKKKSDELAVKVTSKQKVGTKHQNDQLKSLKSAVGTPKKEAKEAGFFSKLFSGLGGKLDKTFDNALNMTDRKKRDDMRILRMKLMKEAKRSNLYASLSSFYNAAVMSKCSRMALQVRGSSARVFLGERMRYLFEQFRPEIQKKYRNFIKEIKTSSRQENGDLPPFLNLRELSQRPFNELKSIFVSHSRTYRMLSEFEIFLRNEVMLEDQFLPLMHASQCISRDTKLFDQIFMDQNRLMLTMGAEDDFRNKGDKIGDAIRRSREEEEEEELQQQQRSAQLAGEEPTVIRQERTFDLKGVVGGGSGSGSSPLKMTKTVLNERTKYATKKVAGKKESFVDPILQQAQLQHNLSGDKMKMPYDLCHILDGTTMEGGIRELMQKHLDINEALLSFNLSQINSNLEVLIIWKEEPDFEDKASRQMTGDPEIDNIPKPNHIIMELVKSDVDTSTLTYLISGWLEAIGTRPNAKRLPRCTDVLHSMSCALAMTEIVRRLPGSIDTLHICYNDGPLACIPWNLLLIEMINPIISTDTSKINQTYKNPDGNPVTTLSADEVLNGLGQSNSKLTGSKGGKLLLSVTFEHLIERYTILMGPSLTLFELSNNYSAKLKHVSGLHKMVAIDGDTPFTNKNEKNGSKNGTPLSKKTSFKGKPEEAREGKGNSDRADFAGGVRATQLEVGGCCSVWSADPSDHRVLMGSHASLANLKSKAAREKKKKKTVSHTERQKKLEKELREENERAQKPRSMVNAEDDFKLGLDARDVNDISTDEDSDSEEENAKDEDRKSLFTCRVLHISSFKHDLDNQNDTGINLPINESEGELNAKKKKNQTKDFALKFTSSFRSKEGGDENWGKGKPFMNARDVVSQLYLPNCALVVLSRFSLCDDIVDPNLVDSSLGFLESFFLAGATSVLYPLWSGVAMGHGSLAHQLILLHFYSNLPSFAHDKRSIAKCIRKSMFWLRASTADDIIAFVNRLPCNKNVKTRLIEEMESYVAASLSPTKLNIDKSKLDLEGKNGDNSDSKGNRVGGNRLFFTHFINWAFFVVAGHGGNIHHPELVVGEGILSKQLDSKIQSKLNLLATKAQVVADDAHNVHKSVVDLEPDNAEFEYELLISEGKLEEARMFKDALKAQKWKKINDRVSYVANAARVGMQKVADGLDVLDKTFLDQDSDEIEVSDDDKKKKKPDPKAPIPDEDRGFSGFLKTKKVQKQLPKIEPIDRVKYHFGYGDQSPGVTLTPAAPGLQSPEKRNEFLGKKNAIQANKLNQDDPANWDQYTSPRVEVEKRKYDKKVKFGRDQVDLNGSSGSLWVNLGEEMKPKEEIHYSDEEEDDAPDSDIDDLSDDGLKERLSKVGKTTFKKIHKNITSIKREVRSYEEAQRIATAMLKNLPNTSILPDFSKKKSSKIFDAHSIEKTHSNEKIAEISTKKDDCTVS